MAGYTDIPPSYFDTLIARPGEMLADTAVGVIEGGRKLRDMYNTTEDYLDEGLARVGDLFDRSPPMMTGGPMSRNGYRHHPGGYIIPANASLTPEAQAYRDRAAFGNPHVLSYDFPTQQSYDNAVAEGHLANKEYNIMRSGMDYPVDNRSDWQKWKDSTKSGRR